MNQLKQFLLFCPGPVNVAPNIMQAMNNHIGHREEEFSELLSGINEKLLDIYEIKNKKKYHPVIITGSGTAANETVLSSIVGKKQILVITNGEFGERLVAISKQHNKHTHKLSFAWGEQISLEKIEAYLQKKSIDIIAMVHHETSTGMLNPIDKVGKLAKKYNAQFFVDTVSSAVAEKVDIEKWNITFCTTSSGKAVSSIPGLGIIMGEKKAFEALATQKPKIIYLNLYNLYKYSIGLVQTPNTPAVHLFYALDQAMTNILTVGTEKWRQQVKERALMLRAGMQKLGLQFLIDEQLMSSVLTTVHLPQGITSENLKQNFKDRKIIVYSGKGPLVGKVFQVGNIGDLTAGDITYFLHMLNDIITGSKSKRTFTQEITLPVLLQQTRK